MAIAQTVKRALMYETGLDYLLTANAFRDERLEGLTRLAITGFQLGLVGYGIDALISGDTRLALHEGKLVLVAEGLKHVMHLLYEEFNRKASEILAQTIGSESELKITKE